MAQTIVNIHYGPKPTRTTKCKRLTQYDKGFDAGSAKRGAYSQTDIAAYERRNPITTDDFSRGYLDGLK